MYRNPKDLLTILNNTLKQNNIEMTLGFIMGMLENADIFLKEDDIKKYLEKEKKKYIVDKDIERMNGGQKIIYKLTLDKYKYIPYTYNYYKKTIYLLKKKCINFVRLIDSIVEKSISNDIINKYDISINKDGDILDSDIKRIIEPFVYNLYLLIETINEANDLKTYYDNKIDLDLIYLYDADEQSIYPSEELQPSDINTIPINNKSFIPFTTRQEVERENKRMLNFSEMMRSLERDFPTLLHEDNDYIKRS